MLRYVNHRPQMGKGIKKPGFTGPASFIKR